MSTSSPPRPTLPQVLLGVFILWQLLFLFGSSLLGFFVDREVAPPLVQTARTGFLQWEYLTGQTQYWTLFSPSIYPKSQFLVVELRWDGAPARQLPVLGEPSSDFHYLHLPGPGDRLFNYEQEIIAQIHVRWEPEDVAEHAAEIQEAQRKQVRRYWRPTLAYLRWRLKRFQEENPGLPPPREVILRVRLYQPPEPGTDGWQWKGPTDKPLVRWRPDAKPDDSLPLEVYDPGRQDFERLPLAG